MLIKIEAYHLVSYTMHIYYSAHSFLNDRRFQSKNIRFQELAQVQKSREKKTTLNTSSGPALLPPLVLQKVTHRPRHTGQK
jgi:hypothetical protein